MTRCKHSALKAQADIAIVVEALRYAKVLDPFVSDEKGRRTLARPLGAPRQQARERR